MKLLSIELKNYRNYRETHIDFDKNVTIFFGDNAQGKTNVLEAIYVCATTKSHRSAKDRDLILFGEDEAHIKMMLEEGDRKVRVDMHIKKNKSKGIAVDGVMLKKASDLFGYLNVVFFSPEDLNIIKNGPGERRKFIDFELCQLDKIYLHNIVNYNKVLSQRSRLLKDMAFFPDFMQLLEVYDSQLNLYGDVVIRSRKKFIGKLNDIIKDIHQKLTGGKEELEIIYEMDVDEGNILDTLQKNRERDIKQKVTNAGPHRDDIKFVINGIDVRRFGSQGQQRTAALSLKMAEIRLVEMMTNEKPILLLDDVLSELDCNRQNYLLNSIKDIQTLITCTGLDEFVNNRFHIDRVYRVMGGHIVSHAHL